MPMRSLLPALASFNCLATGLVSRAHAADPWWNAAVEAQLTAAGDNRPQLEQFLNDAPADRRDGAAFLVEHMPASDLPTLTADLLLENLALAYDAWEASAWRDQVPQDTFFNDVLPYASLSEPRDPWRTELHKLCAPLVADCKTPGEAARVLNEKVFPLVRVRYNTGRRRTDQSPRESMASGMATCTGLSILLVDACRSVAVPARVVGTPMWSNNRGNHTWVEVWDAGDWHFVGAAEPDPAGLDRAWFTHEASEAKADVPRHAIYASSFRRTDVPFPMVWARRNKSISAVNVTHRYAAGAAATADIRLAVKVTDSAGKRVVADILVTDLAAPGSPLKDSSRGETADLNNLATFQLATGHKYRVKAQLNDLSAAADVETTAEPEQLVTLVLAKSPAASDQKAATGGRATPP